jgi:hypothetical protein
MPEELDDGAKRERVHAATDRCGRVLADDLSDREARPCRPS